MAKEITVELVDDITGESGATTTSFGLDGVDYEIDLVDDHDLRASVGQWIAKARRISGKDRSKPTKEPARQRHDMHHIRVWARNNGLTVPARGRMPRSIVDAYDAPGTSTQ